MTSSEETSQDILLRLRRIEGQVRGLQRMIEEHRGCEDIITQIMAVRAALDRVGTMAVQQHIHECASGPPQEAKEKLGRATELLLKLSH